MRVVYSIIGLIASRTVSAFLLCGVHTYRFYYLKVMSVRDIASLLLVLAIVNVVYPRATYKGQYILRWFRRYVVTFSVVMLYPFIPVFLYNEKVVRITLLLFNSFWVFSAVSLFIYAYVYRKEIIA